MPHLILEFTADREIQDIGFGQISPTGKESLYFRIIDTDTGKIAEISGEAKNVRHQERKPTWGELKVAEETLGRKPDATMIDSEIHTKIVKQLEETTERLNQAKADLVVKNDTIVSQQNKISEYESKDMTDGRDILASALDSYLEDLAASQEFDKYEQGKRIYRRLTGQKWVDDGEDDEEGDLPT